MNKNRKTSNMEKPKQIKPDEVFHSGFIQIARYGQYVSFKNLLNNNQHKEFIEYASNRLTDVTDDINSTIQNISNIIVKIHPLQLLTYSSKKYILSMIDIKSEAELSNDQIVNMRMIDYVQNVIVSAQPKGDYKDLEENEWNSLYKEVKSLFNNINIDYSIARTASQILNNPNFDHGWDQIYTESQMLWNNVKGKRYSNHNISHFKDLLEPHDSVFKEIFKFSIHDFILGLDKIQNTFISGFGLAINDFREFKNKTLEAIFTHPKIDFDTLSPPEQMQKVITENKWKKWQEDILGKFFGTNLYNISKITNFPEEFLKEFSWEPGEESSFLSGEYKGWPLKLQPIMVRPFLWINGECYLFDIFSLMDNIYRAIQRKIIINKPGYRDEWNKRQKLVTESLPVNLFKKLLPGCIIFQSVYYKWFPKNDSQNKDWCESDLLILYDDHLIIIEVKAGAFTYTPPSTDFPAYIESIKNLLEKPSLQGKRFLNYLQSEDQINIYNQKYEIISKIKKSDYRLSTICCLTLDNFTSISARAESLKPINIDVGDYPIWALSIDDLRVYCDIFTSPLIFLHFLEERQRAFTSKEFSTNDEIDHLGLYLKYNRYVTFAEELYVDTPVTWNSMRMEIDNYYSQQTIDPDTAKIPEQEMPVLWKEIVSIVEKKDNLKKSHFISVLFDLDGTTRFEIETKISELLEKQSDRNRLLPLNVKFPAPVTIFCIQPNVAVESNVWMRDYTSAFLIRTNNHFRILTQLYYDSNSKLIDVNFEFIYTDNIPDDRMEEIKNISSEQAKRFIENYMRSNNLKKIKVNEQCPCGSGKKYKKCCGQL